MMCFPGFSWTSTQNLREDKPATQAFAHTGNPIAADSIVALVEQAYIFGQLPIMVLTSCW